jgi:hypothetical protein
LQARATQLVRLLNEPGSLLARVVDAIGKKNGAGEAVAPVSEAPPAAAAPASEAPPAAPASEAPPSAAPPGDAAPSA